MTKGAWRLLAAVAVVLALRRLSTALAPVIAAGILAYVIDPLVARLSRRMPREAASLIATVAMVLVAAGVGVLVVPMFVQSAADLAAHVPDDITWLEQTALPWLRHTLHLPVPASLGEIEKRVAQHAASWAGGALGVAGAVAGGLLSSVPAALGVLLAIVFVPVLTFFVSSRLPRIIEFAGSLAPVAYRGRVAAIAGEVDARAAAWIRGQLALMAIEAVLYGAGFSVVGVEHGLPIGVLTGALTIVPYAGPLCGTALATLMALVHYDGLARLVGVWGVYAAVHLLDATVLLPRLMGGRTGLGPPGVVIALLVFGELFGLVGVLLAVPLAATIVIVLRHLYLAWQLGRTFHALGMLAERVPPG